MKNNPSHIYIQSLIPVHLSQVGLLNISKKTINLFLISNVFISKATIGPIGKAAANKVIYPKSIKLSA